ncbi:MAG: hypothetical protein A3G34_04125 [Candidatus Lindowbacteria bacterium RIFCSPLOWO2_12_FULL_62_27]|nr:MAG: hypothetical protein A3G34_04125 [Candidatus Lindowbacteria bacterium RIFCSPLOWO2_12_FULL_62_27]OGH63635.1 MAG: hypothetical protein A3I06_14265 [Candidatus Lindowbacteria bacterium RIFCSPLOWO2_02_FULL_62_12]
MKRRERPPAFQFYPDNYLSDPNVEMMSLEEQGANWRLICHAWKQEDIGTLPNDDTMLAALSRLGPERWEACKKNVLRAWDAAQDGILIQKRLVRELRKQQEHQKARQLGGKLGADRRWHTHRSPMGHPKVSHKKQMAKDGFSSPTPPSSSTAVTESTPAVPAAGGTDEPTGELSDNGWGTPEALVELYNQKTPDECPEVTTLSPARQIKAKKYLAMFSEREFWDQVCVEIHHSKFLRGLNNTPGHGKFVASFDWLLTKGQDGTENAVKVYEGQYRDS